MILTVIHDNWFFPIGTSLRILGSINGFDSIECVQVGHFVSPGYQHLKDGQVVWVKRMILNSIGDNSLLKKDQKSRWHQFN
jgi:hypothetical protein